MNLLLLLLSFLLCFLFLLFSNILGDNSRIQKWHWGISWPKLDDSRVARLVRMSKLKADIRYLITRYYISLSTLRANLIG
ncbi:hypothetical protein BKA61DRAFT_41924 [Leptodontidium sp. MPI-SDFR-AT-0119]|nr:hypothetical protein BKA61DRAFT_41924 [Leptodontidium sp. MPI-SDFR-AT-0119]